MNLLYREFVQFVHNCVHTRLCSGGFLLLSVLSLRWCCAISNLGSPSLFVDRIGSGILISLTVPVLLHDLLALLFPFFFPFFILFRTLAQLFLFLWDSGTRRRPPGDVAFRKRAGIHRLLAATTKSRNVFLRRKSGANFAFFAQAAEWGGWGLAWWSIDVVLGEDVVGGVRSIGTS